MTYAERWLLPDGVEDILPEKAARIESMRRSLLDLYGRWGYEMIIPPMVEYTDSLLIGLGQDIDLLTFKVMDQLTGRTMGIRADITPQTARIDAHSLRRDGVSRLCYASHVLYTKPKSPLGTRSPLQAGVELYGEEGLGADVEVMSLLLSSLQEVGLEKLNMDLGHVAIYRGLVEAAGLNDSQEKEFFDLLQSKAVTELNAWADQLSVNEDAAAMLKVLPLLAGDRTVLARARDALWGAPVSVAKALDELDAVAEVLEQRYPQADLYFDLAELRGARYHTGLVFAAFAPGYGTALANGGRYDHVGGVFGNGRPATGFSVDVTALDQLLSHEQQQQSAIFAHFSPDPEQWNAITELRKAGEKVVTGFAGQEVKDITIRCDRQLVLKDGQYLVVDL
ncbi:MAG: ATP phosphoribosyltransferase regulatory subunit [Candidatus Pelagadaptatus aseana]|uniref:ATP phosphoribosyltransferase regulatory subunit n=1 Tax=Candidatus Pelagadaptatus aseana TaxID=3120508 RepID=UPI0039B33BB0